MEVEWKWISESANEKAHRLAQLGTRVYLKDPDTRSHVVQGHTDTLAKAKRLGWRILSLRNKRRVVITGTRRAQIGCRVPSDDGELMKVSIRACVLCSQHL